MKGSPPAAVVVGTGFGLRVHVPALRAAGFDVVAAVGKDPDRTARRGARVGVRAANSLDEALHACGSRPTLVTVATPPATHCEVALEALASGAHVLCEKPFASDAAQARRMTDAAEAAGTVAAVGHEFRWATDRAVLARALAAGRIGQPRMVTLISSVPLVAGLDAPAPAWWFDAKLGGGWLGASGSHAIDQILWWLGEIAEVSASTTVVSGRQASAEDAFAVRFSTASGVAGVLQQTSAAWGPAVNVTRVAGAHGTLWLSDGATWVADATGVTRLEPPVDLRLPDVAISEDPRERFTHLELGPYTQLVTWLGEAIVGRRSWPPPADAGSPVPATFVDGLRCTEVIDAIRLSARQRGATIVVTPRRGA